MLWRFYNNLAILELFLGNLSSRCEISCLPHACSNIMCSNEVNNRKRNSEKPVVSFEAMNDSDHTW